ncbi:hypothetical protein ACFQ9X_19495 [Catenulispora yoronensis]
MTHPPTMQLFAGVDTHADTHHAAVIDQLAGTWPTPDSPPPPPATTPCKHG